MDSVSVAARAEALLQHATLSELGASTLHLHSAHEKATRLGVTMSSEHGVGTTVCAVERGSRAERAGLIVGDRITRVSGVRDRINELAARREPLDLEVIRARRVRQVPFSSHIERRVEDAHYAPCTREAG
ncbi:hypothetical protein EMIHUDRAFT_206719 [Emiliania huxleyi CCMP1516]|uniref:PDZ domain-containing protein n=2 Tax=Emiliania huxleyi TaxID=2903 RepID=A0A0D3JMB9_EMIH1|nr:hypothetical protein EMIHUDRAFT_206719 [Emiliania huxleyi CCMP1516]EOD24654.1 hypothetical protein EMIHUDRAFT_206719 [Emiliania huxleyi CCMP1516]|eukprot:XP_005777083.1 hypothetical protein EMIHUDRAFT_206719 [Emiliania huxleyi CCMP1516]